MTEPTVKDNQWKQSRDLPVLSNFQRCKTKIYEKACFPWLYNGVDEGCRQPVAVLSRDDSCCQDKASEGGPRHPGVVAGCGEPRL